MSDYGIQFADWFDRPHETMVGEMVFDSEGNAIGWIVNTEPGEATMPKLHSRMNAVLLDMQEELLAYHPQDRENASSKELIDCVIRAHQIVEDAATVDAGTCDGSFHKSSDLSSGKVPLYYCKGTNKSIFVEREAKVCPLCGGRIKEDK